ncbi:unnamed protein product [Microthlaspi erraticum]|uniref:Zinc finger PMZ-type domain-containing protein n=1 Tax=Microthlaspi erraticum TaxID=1685480 RepID=A0A6D2KSW0_9BRAS|nr:unnamed protein product [Microthlaspi erraticum]
MEFQVQEQSGECHIVKILDGTCSCMKFQLLGMPSAHAIASAVNIELPTDFMVSWGFYGETWTRGFDGKIYPVPSVGGGDILDPAGGDLLPPNVRRLQKSGIHNGRRCTRCRRQGHNKASCRFAI